MCNAHTHFTKSKLKQIKPSDTIFASFTVLLNRSYEKQKLMLGMAFRICLLLFALQLSMQYFWGTISGILRSNLYFEVTTLFAPWHVKHLSDLSAVLHDQLLTRLEHRQIQEESLEVDKNLDERCHMIEKSRAVPYVKASQQTPPWRWKGLATANTQMHVSTAQENSGCINPPRPILSARVHYCTNTS